MAIFEITNPPVEPVTLTEAKNHCRVDVDDDDTVIQAFIRTAREYCEKLTGKAYVQRNVMLTMSHWPPSRQILLPRPPLADVISVEYLDSDGNTETLTPGDDYIVDLMHSWGRIVLPVDVHWPMDVMFPGTPIRITYTAGYPVTALIVDEDVGTGDATQTQFTLADAPVESVQGIFVGGALQDPTTDYTIDMQTGVITFDVTAIPPLGDAIEADYTPASYYTENVPESVKKAIALCLGNWYENRENVLPAGHVGKLLPQGAEALLEVGPMGWTREWNE